MYPPLNLCNLQGRLLLGIEFSANLNLNLSEVRLCRISINLHEPEKWSLCHPRREFSGAPRLPFHGKAEVQTRLANCPDCKIWLDWGKIEKSQWCTIVTWQYAFWQSIASIEGILVQSETPESENIATLNNEIVALRCLQSGYVLIVPCWNKWGVEAKTSDSQEATSKEEAQSVPRQIQLMKRRIAYSNWSAIRALEMSVAYFERVAWSIGPANGVVISIGRKRIVQSEQVTSHAHA